MGEGKKERPTKDSVSHLESFEWKKMYLEAVLAEYKRLTDEIMTHQKNLSYIFAVMVGGVATILGVFGFIGFISFLLIPIFISSCCLLILSEGFGGVAIGNYVKKEIEDKKLSNLFKNDSPIQWEGQSRGALFGAFWILLFTLSVFLCWGSLTAVVLSSWNEVCSNIFYQLIYSFGWMIVIFYTISAGFVFVKFSRLFLK